MSFVIVSYSESQKYIQTILIILIWEFEIIKCKQKRKEIKLNAQVILLILHICKCKVTHIVLFEPKMLFHIVG